MLTMSIGFVVNMVFVLSDFNAALLLLVAKKGWRYHVVVVVVVDDAIADQVRIRRIEQGVIFYAASQPSASGLFIQLAL